MNLLLKHIGLLAILFFLTLIGYSQEKESEKIIPEIQSIQDTYEESIKVASSPLATLGKKYIEALTGQLEKAQKAGNFKEVVALKKAVEEFNKNESLDGLSDSPSVARLERIASQQFKLRIKSAEKPVLKAAKIRVSQLKQALKDLTKSGNFKSAEKIDQFIKSLPTRYDSSWAQSEIKRVASVDGVKVPITVEERPSPLFVRKEKPKTIPPKLTDPPEIISVDYQPKRVQVDELTEGIILVRCLNKPTSLRVSWQFANSVGSDIQSIGGFEAMNLGDFMWLTKVKTRFTNSKQIGLHQITQLRVTNDETQTISSDWVHDDNERLEFTVTKKSVQNNSGGKIILRKNKINSIESVKFTPKNCKINDFFEIATIVNSNSEPKELKASIIFLSENSYCSYVSIQESNVRSEGINKWRISKRYKFSDTSKVGSYYLRGLWVVDEDDKVSRNFINREKFQEELKINLEQ